MPKSRKRKKPKTSASRSADAYERYKKVALEQARRVAWPRLAAAVDQYNQWESFTLWAQAIVDAAHSIPPLVEQQIRIKVPGFLEQFEEGLRSAPDDKRGDRLRELSMKWVWSNILFEPQKQGWFDAMLYFATHSLPYMKAGAHWELVDDEWRDHPPAAWPSYEEWQRDVEAVSHVTADVDEKWQYALDAMRSVPAAEWERMWSAFLEFSAFILWMELILDADGPRSPLVAEEIRKHYPAFSFSESDLPSSDAVRELSSWLFHAMTADEQILAALAWLTQHHPAYYATRNYAVHLHDLWSHDCPKRWPSYDEFRRASDTFTG